jgi:tripartite-type tricarboxylate transporter receptor subunit TctC
VKTQLHAAGLVERALQRGAHRRKRERKPGAGMMLHQDGSRARWLADEAPLAADVVGRRLPKTIRHLVDAHNCAVWAKGHAMKFRRREFLYLAAGAATFAAAPRIARAQAYPRRPVRMIVASAAGGSPDIVARLMGQWLSERLGQPFVIENRPGAAGNIGTEAVVRAPPDGYTLLLVPPSSAINATLYEKLNFNFIRDTAPVASIALAPSVMEVAPKFPAKTVPEFIAYAKANPGKLNMASGGNGTIQHVSGELFKMMTGVNMLHVPYRSAAPAMTDLLGGQVQVMFNTTPTSIEYIRTGRLRALAVSSATRVEALPDVPTVGEFVPGYDANSWYGIVAPKNTPVEIIDRLNREINASLADPGLRARLADQGTTVFTGSSADFGKFIADETEKWAKVIKFAGIKPE